MAHSTTLTVALMAVTFVQRAELVTTVPVARRGFMGTMGRGDRHRGCAGASPARLKVSERARSWGPRRVVTPYLTSLVRDAILST